MSLLSDILRGQNYIQGSTYTGPTPKKYTKVTPLEPNQQYSTPYTAPVVAPSVQPTPTTVKKTATPIFTGGKTEQTTQKDLYAKYRNPATGEIMSPKEYALYIASKVPTTSSESKKAGNMGVSGDIGKYVGDQIMNPDQSSADLKKTARGLEASQGDIAVGETDPYGNKGIPFSPEERRAIESAYAGIYDPAIKDVYAKLEAKQKAEDLKASQDFELSKMAKQHEYDMAEKGLTGTGLGTGTYTPGENPTVDAWAQRIFDGTAKITDIPASDKGMRNAVTVALTSYGNQVDGKPTTTEIGLQTLDAAKRLKKMLDNRTGTQAVGGSRFWAGGAIQSAMPGSESFDFSNLYNTVIANRSLEGVKFLKGQGQVSDAERLLLKQAMSELALAQSEEQFKNSLQQIIDKLEGNATETSGEGDIIEFID